MRLFPLFHRSNTASSAKSLSSTTTTTTTTSTDGGRSRSKTSLLFLKHRPKYNTDRSYESSTGDATSLLPSSISFSTPVLSTECQSIDPQQTPATSLHSLPPSKHEKDQPRVTIQEPTPDLLPPSLTASTREVKDVLSTSGDKTPLVEEAEIIPQRPDVGPRRQSLANPHETRFLKTLLEPDRPPSQSGASDYFGRLSANMLHRKIWVKRPGASATLVVISEDDLVDDVRDMILKKYANSLGRSFDSPDVTLRIVPRDQSHRHSQGERTLGPEEPITRTLDAYYPGGQTVDDALLIDVPPRRTPRHSPRVQIPYYVAEDIRPGESGTDYFPPMPMGGAPSPHLPSSLSVTSGQSGSHHPSVHSISVLSTGQVPLLPSPGGRNQRHPHRPKYGRTHTSSPTMVQSIPLNPNDRSQLHLNGPPVPPPLPTPPLSTDVIAAHRAATPPPRISSPRPAKTNGKRGSRFKPSTNPSLPLGLLDGAVPPINVLIVEDNIINLKLLEAFMKRLKVRWHTAMNGREAVNKWKEGGFHLVLMDIQLPVMNGLEATKEIRRLERINGVGFGSPSANGNGHDSGNGNGKNAAGGEASEDADRNQAPEGEDRFMNTELFKSPVIIVALTASSLQSDRHEALAAGCNDFLTKPVNFVWLERKVMEWGCMQALIDFDGWRKWKDFSQGSSASKNNNLTGKTSLLTPSAVNNSTTTNSSGPSTKESPKDGTKNKKAVAMNGGMVPLQRVGSGVGMGRKEKRKSLGGGSLTGVLEDGEEDGDGEKACVASTSGKVIVAGA